VPLIAVVVLATALLLVPAAAGRDTLIRPGVGIGRIDLGMTQAQVRRALGPHDTGWSERRGLGVRYLELTWDRGPEDYFAVGLLGRPGRLRVVSIATTRRADTYRGIGPGDTVVRLRRTIRGLRCLEYWPAGGGMMVESGFVLGRRNGPQTVFVRGKWRFYRSNPAARVAYVVVRTPAALHGVTSQPCRG
jgi:hypothetical protein